MKEQEQFKAIFYYYSIAECPPLDNIEFGSVSQTTNRVLGVATYACNTGHTLKGSCERVCLENGAWTGTKAICLPPGTGLLS